jgi:hypothetical protein
MNTALLNPYRTGLKFEAFWVLAPTAAERAAL